LNNRVIDRFTAEERRNIGVHTCPGGDCDASHSAGVDYADLLPDLFKMNAGYFLIALAGEADKERVCKLIGEHRREDANGVAQDCFIGVTSTVDPRVESAEEICGDLMLAAKYIPKEHLGSTDNCGFSPFSLDSKPKHGTPDAAREIAFQKIANRVKGTQMASERLGVQSKTAVA
jgi:methionine synthase II (cobalamin-independent)